MSSLVLSHRTGRANPQIALEQEAVQVASRLQEALAPVAETGCLPDLVAAAGQLPLLALNRALYRCQAETEDGVYDIPGHGPLVFSGLEGIAKLLEAVAGDNNLGHPVCQNLREGNWLMDHCVRRLKGGPELVSFGTALAKYLGLVGQMPRPLVPAYFARVVDAARSALQQACVSRMSSFVQGGDAFLQGLALTSVQLYGADPHGDRMPLLAAGLPHFAAGWARCWGRYAAIASGAPEYLFGALPPCWLSPRDFRDGIVRLCPSQSPEPS